jgi:TolB-like protein
MRILEGEPAPLVSVPGVSTELSGTVARLLHKDPSNRLSADEVLTALGGPTVALPPPRSARSKRALLITALAALAGAGAAAIVWAQHRTARDVPASQVGTRPLIGVLGFKNKSGRSEVAWLSTALSELTSRALAAGERLVVLSGDTVARAKADLAITDADPAVATLKRVRGLTGAQHVVLGSYSAGEEASDKIELDARLVDTASGEPILSAHEAGTKSELFELTSRVATPFRKKLGVSAASATDLQLARAAIPSNPEAFQLYVEGLSKLWEYAPIPASYPLPMRAARDLFEKAAKISADNASIHASLAEVLTQLGYLTEAGGEIKIALDKSAGLPREERLRIEATYRSLMGEAERRSLMDEAERYPIIYRTLFDAFPENLEYGLALAGAQPNKEALRGVLAELRKLPAPASEDLRIDLLEASATQSLSEGESLAARAAAKANDLGARITAADAKAGEGHLALIAGNLDHAESALRNSEQIYSNVGNRASLLVVLHDLYVLRWMRGASWSELDQSLTSAAGVAHELGGRSWKLPVFKDRVDHALWAGDLSRALSDKPSIGVKLAASNLESFVSGRLNEAARIVDLRLSATGISMAHRRPQLLIEKGNILLAQGDFGAARTAFQEAHAATQATGAQPDLANASLGLASVAVEEMRFLEAERSATAALEIFLSQSIALFEPDARIALARALFGQDRNKEARAEIERAGELARGLQLRRQQLDAAVLVALLDAATKRRADIEKALSALRKITSDAERLQLKHQEFHARRATVEIEMTAGLPAGEAHFAALKQDAGKAGFGLYAQLVQPAKGMGTGPSSNERQAPAAPKPYRRSKIKPE